MVLPVPFAGVVVAAVALGSSVLGASPLVVPAAGGGHAPHGTFTLSVVDVGIKVAVEGGETSEEFGVGDSCVGADVHGDLFWRRRH